MSGRFTAKLGFVSPAVAALALGTFMPSESAPSAAPMNRRRLREIPEANFVIVLVLLSPK